MYYDYYDDWSTHKEVTLTNYDGGTWSDYPGRAGKPLQVRRYETTSYADAPADRSFTEVSSSRFSYKWTNVGDGPGYRNPRRAHKYYQRNRVKLDDGSWREDSQRMTEFNDYGLPTEIVDWNDLSVSDNTCSSISYAAYDSGPHYNIDFPETVETWSDDVCGQGDLVTKRVTLYDGRTEDDLGSQDPYDGDPTQVRTYTSPSEYVATETSYDDYGRATSKTDELGQTTTIDYDPPANWPLGGVTTTNPAGHATTEIYSPSHGQLTEVFDANGKKTDVVYDQLGRPVEVFLPGDPVGDGIASLKFGYDYTWNGTTGQPSAATRVATHALHSKADGGQYVSSYVFDDGYGRKRETQTTSPAGGRIVTAQYYNARGMVQAASEAFHNTGTAGDGLANSAVDTLPAWTRTSYDGLGRATSVDRMAKAGLLWSTTTDYSGNHTTVTPPAGAAPVTTWHDVHGNTTLRQDHLDDGTTVDTTYTYDREHQLTKVVDDAGNQWTYTYDLAGRETQSTDPDAGTTTFTYDDAGRPTSTTDARGHTVSTTYDALGRETARWDGAAGSGTLLAEWEYDTLQTGRLTSKTRWHDGQQYTTTIAGYTDRSQPTGTTVSIPAAEGALAGDYTYSYSYTDAGDVQTLTLPAAAGMPSETLTSSYTDLGRADRLTSDYDGGATYVDATGYDSTGDLIQQLLGSSPGQVARDLAWDEATGRLHGITTTADADTTNPTTVQDDAHTYDPAGNISTITDHTTGQAQCFAYDTLRRLVQAWTTTAGCDTDPTNSTVDGPDPYWHTWTFDTIGNRLTHTEHPTTTGGEQTSTTYTYPDPGQPQPHTLTEKSVTDDAGTVVTGYSYDQTGNTTSRPGDNGQQTLTWTPEGHLDTVTDETGTTGYIYDTDGNRLITHHADGTATLYLPENVEIAADLSGATTCTRYYGDIAMRTNSGLTWLAADHHNTATYAIDANTQQVTTRRSDPYGNPRGTVTNGPWPNDKTFLGATQDPTGLVHLGAREYDPTTGRFISLDPVMDLTDPQQIHGYTYANNNPATWNDPTGRLLCSTDGINICPGQDPSSQLDRNSGGSSSGGDRRIWGDHRSCVDVCGSHADNWLRNHNGGTPTAGGQTGPVEPDGAGATRDDYAKLGNPEATSYRQLNPEEKQYVSHMVWAANNPKAYAEYIELVSSGSGGYGIVAELIGLADAARCVGGDMSSCAWAAVGLTPLKPLKWGDEAINSARRLFCSFTGDTRILMADGTTKQIRDIELGDRVLATDPETGKTAPQAVTARWTHEDAVIDLNLGNGSSLTTTTDHPFRSYTDQQWQVAAELEPGDQLATANDEYAAIVGLDRSTIRRDTAYNLTIEKIHTYYALAGDISLLVHNKCDLDLDALARSGAREVSPGLTRAGQKLDRHGGGGCISNPYWLSCQKEHDGSGPAGRYSHPPRDSNKRD